MLFLYRSLSTTALDDLEVILMALSSHVHSVVIAGDLNVDLLFHTVIVQLTLGFILYNMLWVQVMSLLPRVNNV